MPESAFDEALKKIGRAKLADNKSDKESGKR
jgi:hypothetical protein